MNSAEHSKDMIMKFKTRFQYCSKLWMSNSAEKCFKTFDKCKVTENRINLISNRFFFSCKCKHFQKWRKKKDFINSKTSFFLFLQWKILHSINVSRFNKTEKKKTAFQANVPLICRTEWIQYLWTVRNCDSLVPVGFLWIEYCPDKVIRRKQWHAPENKTNNNAKEKY